MTVSMAVLHSAHMNSADSQACRKDVKRLPRETRRGRSEFVSLLLVNPLYNQLEAIQFTIVSSIQSFKVAVGLERVRVERRGSPKRRQGRPFADPFSRQARCGGRRALRHAPAARKGRRRPPWERRRGRGGSQKPRDRRSTRPIKLQKDPKGGCGA